METKTVGSENELHRLVALTMIDKVGPKTCRSLLQHFGGGEGVFKAPKGSLSRIPYVGEKVANAIAGRETMLRAEREVEFCAKHGIEIISWEDPRFPRKLKEVDDSPLVFYCLGNMPSVDQPHIAVVGTRSPSNYGRKIANEFSAYFASLGIVVVSGLALGIDMEAHASTMNAKGTTLAVLGHGLDQVYPREHTLKAREIVQSGGALISEFPSGTQPEAFNFPARNRIISGLCDAIVVVEATDKGGALITARMGFDQNREVFAIPGNIGSPTAVGCNRLIRDHIAKIACCPQDVIDGLQHLMRYRTDDSHHRKPVASLQLSEREQIVMSAFDGEPVEVDFLSATMGIGGAELRGILLGLEFRGIVVSVPGNKYQIA